MIQKIKEKISMFTIKKPRAAVIIGIFLLNIVLLFISGLVINIFMRDVFPEDGFWVTIYKTIGMIFDAGMIETVVGYDVSQSSVVLVIISLLTIIIGNITFTGAIIGYVTNYISSFIDNIDSSSRQIKTSDHTIILNWNSRASEIINDMIYLERKETIIVLVNQNSDAVKKEIAERLYLTLRNERVKNRLDIIVREGSTYSTKQLYDISLLTAKTIIILGDDDTNYVCKYDMAERQQKQRGNANTIKTLVQVAQITSSEISADNQRIIVEVDDDWTKSVVDRIIVHKEKLGKCNIVPVPVNRILGQLLSQFCIFPELNRVYSELFSNKGAEFFCQRADKVLNSDREDEEHAIKRVMDENAEIVPLTFLDTKTGRFFFYMAEEETAIQSRSELPNNSVNLSVNPNFKLKTRNVIILGHNSKVREIMAGFESFLQEWDEDNTQKNLNILVIDDEKSLERQDYYHGYSYVRDTIAAEVYDTEKIKNSINSFIDSHEEDTSILLLSDDVIQEKDMDAYVLTNLIHVQDIIFERVQADPEYDTDRIDVIVEILNPKNYDVVHNYNIDNIVISNRYISKMVTQIGEKIELFEFYSDILTYDEEQEEGSIYTSKEVYIKPVLDFLTTWPKSCAQWELIRAIYDASPDNNKAHVLGVTHPGGSIELFAGDQMQKTVQLTENDRLIIYSAH